jgi:hypothetical protein
MLVLVHPHHGVQLFLESISIGGKTDNRKNILAGDTRSTSGYNINSRMVPKVFKIGGDDETGEGCPAFP